MTKADYAAALEAARAAARVYREAQTAYRARKIGDAEYLAARAAWEASDKAFDDAYFAACAAGIDLR